MTENFVVIHNSLHECMADLARRTPLIPIFDERKISPNTRRVEDVIHEIEGIERLASARYYELLDVPVFYGNGQPARTSETLYIYDYFDATRVDELCRDGLRSKLTMRATSLFSLDLINYGIGIVRKVRARSNGFYAALKEHLGRIEPNGTKVYQTIIARTHIDPQYTNIAHGEDWQSTNIIYGDAYGEIQQMKDREGDKEFLAMLCEGLNQEPEMSRYWTEEHRKLYQNHLACQKIWDYSPQSPEELVARVDYILANSTLDENPKCSVKLHRVASV